VTPTHAGARSDKHPVDFTGSSGRPHARGQGGEYGPRPTLEPMEREAARGRRATGNDERVDFTPSETGKAMDRVANAVGLSRPTLTKAQEVIEAAIGCG